ncbi:MAG: hypothetical protein U9Q81_09810 [Pseudomonadota bacterium]|nr:hypothetical protein [Pseudomonadota bacterium]
MATRSDGQRLCLQLDPRMAFEALILQRLQRIPTGRRQEWLRGLLVQGFLDECRSRRGADGEACSLRGATTPRPGPAFASWLTQRAPAVQPPPAVKADPCDPPRPAAADTNDKPFAHLRKVIG